MQRCGMLKPGRYPTLRWSLFCGEPLPVELAARLGGGRAERRVENLYGPTEVTITCRCTAGTPSVARGGEFAASCRSATRTTG